MMTVRWGATERRDFTTVAIPAPCGACRQPILQSADRRMRLPIRFL